MVARVQRFAPETEHGSPSQRLYMKDGHDPCDIIQWLVDYCFRASSLILWPKNAPTPQTGGVSDAKETPLPQSLKTSMLIMVDILNL